MTKLKVPSIQHLARNWYPDAEVSKRALIALAKNSPTFGYEPVANAVRDMLLFGVARETIEEGLRRSIKRPSVLDNYLSIIPLADSYFKGIRPTFVEDVAPRYYGVGRGLVVPFRLPLIYGVNGKLFIPWFSFWRSNPLAAERLSLFATMARTLLSQDPDLEEAEFDILDFSAVAPKQPRELRVLSSRDIPTLSSERLAEMLTIFAHAFEMAVAELASEREVPLEKNRNETDSNQPGLF